MRNLPTLLPALVLAVLLTVPAAAMELPHFYKGVRPLGMGGAFTAVADDENALFYNPAGLNRVEDWGMGLINPLIESSTGNDDLYDEIEATDFDVTSEVADLIRDNLGETFHLRAALFPHYVQKNFAVGGLAQIKTNIEFRNAAFPEVATDSFASASGHVGLARGWRDENLRLGIGVKYVVANRLQEVYDVGEIADPGFEDRIEDDLVDGRGVGFDLGAMYTVKPIAGATPTFGVTLLNVADTDLGDAGKLPQQLNVGCSVSKRFAWFDLTGAADWIDVLNDLDQDDDFYKRLHVGVEARFPKILSLRAGLSQGYGSFGIGFDFKLLKLEYANYAEEMSSFTGGHPDRRHVIQIAMGW
jgi:hypothetical protein